MKLRWREIQLLHVLATDLDPRGIDVLIQFGLDDKPRVGRGKCLSKNIFTYTANFQDVVRYGAMTVLGLNEAE